MATLGFTTSSFASPSTEFSTALKLNGVRRSLSSSPPSVKIKSNSPCSFLQEAANGGQTKMLYHASLGRRQVFEKVEVSAQSQEEIASTAASATGKLRGLKDANVPAVSRDKHEELQGDGQQFNDRHSHGIDNCNLANDEMELEDEKYNHSYPTTDTNLANDGVELEDDIRTARVCDKLIDIFMIEKTRPEEWRKLIAFSKEWTNIRPYFFHRCTTRAQEELDARRKADLLKLSRKMKEVDNDMERHNELLAYIKEHETDLRAVVARRRKDFTNDFFEHLGLLYQASYANPDEQQGLASIAEKCYAAVEAYDTVAEEDERMSAAQIKLDDILNSPSLDVACSKIDDLAKRNELDSSLMLLITKAWAASKESNMMKEEVKDILHHLYMVARGNMQRLIPKEVRIMRHVLSLDDPKQQFAALTDAFSPGVEVEGKDIDFLHTTPKKLYDWINIVLDAYYRNKQSSLQSVRELLNPRIISRLEVLKKMMEDQFL